MDDKERAERYGRFRLGEDEARRHREWLDAHRREAHPDSFTDPFWGGAIAGTETFSFTPTGLGCIVKARCFCGAEHDLTDYESW